MVVYKTTTGVRLRSRKKKNTAVIFAVEFSTTKQNMIVEQNCFQEAQNYTSLFVLEKAYREKKVISPCILSRLYSIELCLSLTLWYTFFTVFTSWNTWNV